MVEPIELKLPLTEAAVRRLKAGDMVLLSGSIVTARDRMHKMLLNDKPLPEAIPFSLDGSVLYHCGPVMKQTGQDFRVIAAGPTTSLRVEMYEADVIGRYGIRGIMGKGGMGERTREALKKYGCVYLNTIGGAAAYLADRITKVTGVWQLEEFSHAEAMWQLEVKDFPALVTMDSHGNDLHRDLEEKTLLKFRELAGIK